MKQRFWKELKSEICPKEKWVKDKQQSKCLCCSKQFHAILRRKHHCRFCGNIFCSDCSNFFINGNYIGMPNQKYVRHCQFCHHKIEKFIRQCNQIPDHDLQINKGNQQKAQEFDDLESQEDTQQQNFQLEKIFSQCQKTKETQLQQKLDEQLKTIIKGAAQNLLQKFNIDGKFWAAKLSQLAYKGALQTKMEILGEISNQNAMDIAKIVRFKTIISPENQVTSVLMKGLVLQKNLPIKNMIRHLTKPRILIVEKSIDTDSLTSIFKFQELVKNEKTIMKKILQKIVKLQPDIIFVQNSVSMFALDYLQQRKIVVVSKLKLKDLQAIKYLAKIKKSIQQLWMIDKYKAHNIIGQCDKIYFKQVKQGQSLMFMEGQVGMRTIILGETNQDLVSLLKKSAQILLRFARMLNLLKDVIIYDICMQKAVAKYRSKMDFITFYIPDMNLNMYSLIMKQQINYTNIVFGYQRLNQAPKNYQEYAIRQGKYLMRQICGKVQFQKKKIYSSSDITLGSKILLTVANAQKVCKECNMLHVESFYFNGPSNPICVKIQIEKNEKGENEMKKSLIQHGDQQQALTLQNLKFFLKKQKEMLVFQTYIICGVCKLKLSQSLKLGRNYLQNSFNTFLDNMVQFNYPKDEIKSPDNKTQSNAFRKMNSQCIHQQAVRVIEYSGCMVKFLIEQMKCWNIDQINYKNSESMATVATLDNSFVRSLYNQQLNEKKILLDQLNGIISMFTCFNNIEVNQYINTKAALYQKGFAKAKEAYQKLKQNYVQVKEKSAKYLQQNGHDWTLFMRQIYKIQSVLRPLIQILQFFDSQLRKQKNEESIIKDVVRGIDEFSEIAQNQDNKSFSIRSSVNVPSDSIVKQFMQNAKKDSFRTQSITNFINRNSKCRFPRSQGILLYYTPIFTFDPVSVIASGLNSTQFSKMIKGSQVIPDELKLKLVYNKRLKTNWNVKTEVDSICQEFISDYQKEKFEAVELTIYYHKQFEELRSREGISFELFVRSMCGCRSWDSSGGKSNSKFAKSHNELLVVKIINEKQFVKFQKFANNYLKHIQQSKLVKKESLIARIYGIYEVSIKGKQYKCIVMQNIFFGLSGNLKVYDLKGSEVNRLNMPIGQDDKNITGQDTNFKIDRDFQPLIIPANQYDKITKILQADAAFLKEQLVIDYSLLVILCGNKNIRMGIIDFMRPYQFVEMFETEYKKLRSGKDPTVIPPDQYAQRFFQAMKKYFTKIQN